VEFEWDDYKANINLQKHHLDFQDAIRVFFDPNRIENDDDFVDEERYRVIGKANNYILLVVYTWREDRIRIISARKATKYERQQYYSN
jgi:hypothetical protein